MKEYIVIIGKLKDIKYFEDQCEQKLNSGWKLVGGIAYDNGVVIQAFSCDFD